MTVSINLNPILTTTASGLFNTNSNGFTQGDAQDDPAVKFYLCGGKYDASATAPIFGGMPIQEFIPAAATQPGTDVLGSTIALAGAAAAPTGFSVFNQSFQGITTPQSTAPAILPGMTINYYRLGSGARIPVQLDPASVTIEGDLVSTTVYWDYTANWLTTTQPGVQAAVPVQVIRVSTANNKVVNYSSVTGYANWASSVSGSLVAVIKI